MRRARTLCRIVSQAAAAVVVYCGGRCFDGTSIFGISRIVFRPVPCTEEDQGASLRQVQNVPARALSRETAT